MEVWEPISGDNDPLADLPYIVTVTTEHGVRTYGPFLSSNEALAWVRQLPSKASRLSSLHILRNYNIPRKEDDFFRSMTDAQVREDCAPVVVDNADDLL